MLTPDAITTLLFVCHGNICRSPMAECRMAQLLSEAGVTRYRVLSRATSTEELGNPIYPPARRTLEAHRVPMPPHRATRLSAADVDDGTLLVAMDRANIANMLRLFPQEERDFVLRHSALLLAFDGEPNGEVDDPWYSDDFASTWRDIDRGCRGLLRFLLDRQP